MERFARLCLLHRLLLNQKLPVPLRKIEENLACSRATAIRVIAELRDLTRDPIPYDRLQNGYRYQDAAEHIRDLPFLWFKAPELNALLVMDHHLETLQTGFLSEALNPLRERVQSLLELYGESAGEVRRRIRILPIAHRAGHDPWFSRCAEAVLQRQRLNIDYHGRGTDQRELREISPQRLAHYRDNWYLDAWCHKREALRCFAVERIGDVRVLPQPALDIADDILDAYYAQGYGIFAGPPQATARLRFSPGKARWIADEQWHPQQQGHILPDGSYHLAIPYSDPTELIMDILKYGPDVEVLAPASLREAVVLRLREALGMYG